MSDVAGESREKRQAVELGSWVLVRDGRLDERWRIVTADEADPSRRWMSENTPMARALLGHRAGDRVRVQRPEGRWPVIILAVE